MEDIELRRTKVKLALFDQEGADWLLFDLIDTMDELEGFQTCRSEESKLLILSLLRARYKQYIKTHTPEDPSQTKLFAV